MRSIPTTKPDGRKGRSPAVLRVIRSSATRMPGSDFDASAAADAVFANETAAPAALPRRSDRPSTQDCFIRSALDYPIPTNSMLTWISLRLIGRSRERPAPGLHAAGPTYDMYPL